LTETYRAPAQLVNVEGYSFLAAHAPRQSEVQTAVKFVSTTPELLYKSEPEARKSVLQISHLLRLNRQRMEVNSQYYASVLMKLSCGEEVYLESFMGEQEPLHCLELIKSQGKQELSPQSSDGDGKLN